MNFEFAQEKEAPQNTQLDSWHLKNLALKVEV
jgi:hypothetical protein